MRETVTEMSAKRYYMIIYLLMVIMIVGLYYKNPLYGEGHVGYYFHLLFAGLFSACILIYPKYKTRVLRWLIVLVSTLLFYTLFLVYPETGSTILLIYFIPAIAIIFFDKKLFYTSIILNHILIVGAIAYIISSGQESLYPNVTGDTVGNIITFIGSQVFLYFIFYYTSERIAKLKLYYEQVKHAERLKTTGELAAAVAHEIRNPLTVVKGYLQLYEQDESVNNTMKKSLPMLIEELDSAEQVISQLLSLSQPAKKLITENVDIQKAINSVAELLQSYGILNDNKIEVVVEADSFIEINKMELHQLLVNIVKNAIEASNVGGTITVTAKKIKDNMVEIKVTDQGIGMSEEQIALLGTPFYSLKAKGTGLGLMICNNIVEKYNGSIVYKSSKGNGTTVAICFPSKK
ncbi:ATP-binding protein [Lysinibacillus sp. SGAir0095]|uniref:ATP-binding protein n=1 Tax=Lysinibacillus sp. SGAir0095 TaxID=2070463 RepID=UPI0010CCF7F1|nr:ATP-binding protein [Lysinibacillus sp. SGAir0095]QCR34243.1 sensor histidine kinase [Lysinibacillus sp. SGAir0095]